MIAYYRITELLYEHLIADQDINTCVIGNLDKIDLNKQTIFPLAHILVQSSNTENGMVNFNITVSCMDLVDESKTDLRDETEQWKDLTNYQDVLNTQHAVLENLETSLDKGSLRDLGLEISGPLEKEPFEDRFENLLTGWSSNFDLMIPNEIQGCGNSYTVGTITFSNTLITFSNNNNA